VTDRSRTTTYLLLLLTGLVLGGVAGTEFARRLRASESRGGGAAPAVRAAAADSAAAATDITAVRSNAIVRATREVSPCVVGIVVTQIQVIQSRYYFNDFFDLFVPRVRQVEAMGSGVVIRDDGMILTNYHVINGARTLFVNFPDGRRLEGRIVGADEASDLAVVAVQGGSFQDIKMGDSEKLMIGEWAIAIGNPFLNFINDAHPTVTVGVVSALNRNFQSPEGTYYRGMIQTDAAINPGNSGGPLVDALGRTIGVNTVIYTGDKSNSGWVGIGFAIPINRARRVADELIKYGHRRTVWTGIQAQELTAETAAALGYGKVEGMAVVAVQPGSPGEGAGLRPGDIILRIGTERIRTTDDLAGAFVDLFVGDKTRFVFRRKQEELSTALTLGEYPGGR
jgi:serine protease Do